MRKASPYRIAVVEDDPALAELLEFRFRNEGYQVRATADGDEALLYAIGNYDPAGDANVLSRGIIGSVNGQTVVASPLYKHHFECQK